MTVCTTTEILIAGHCVETLFWQTLFRTSYPQYLRNFNSQLSGNNASYVIWDFLPGISSELSAELQYATALQWVAKELKSNCRIRTCDTIRVLALEVLRHRSTLRQQRCQGSDNILRIFHRWRKIVHLCSGRRCTYL